MYYSFSEAQPEGFIGPNDHWHYHTNTCIKPAADGIDAPLGADQSVTAAPCAAVGGSLLDKTGWIPRKTATFAGALQYREYDFATRLLVRLLMRKEGHPTDVSHDYDYTDWGAVDRFAHECSALLSPEVESLR